MCSTQQLSFDIVYRVHPGYCAIAARSDWSLFTTCFAYVRTRCSHSAFHNIIFQLADCSYFLSCDVCVEKKNIRKRRVVENNNLLLVSWIWKLKRRIYKRFKDLWNVIYANVIYHEIHMWILISLMKFERWFVWNKLKRQIRRLSIAIEDNAGISKFTAPIWARYANQN